MTAAKAEAPALRMIWTAAPAGQAGREHEATTHFGDHLSANEIGTKERHTLHFVIFINGKRVGRADTTLPEALAEAERIYFGMLARGVVPQRDQTAGLPRPNDERPPWITVDWKANKVTFDMRPPGEQRGESRGHRISVRMIARDGYVALAVVGDRELVIRPLVSNNVDVSLEVQS